MPSRGKADWGDADHHGECAGFPMICRTVRGLVSMALIRCRGLLLLTEGSGYLAWGCLGYDGCVGPRVGPGRCHHCARG